MLYFIIVLLGIVVILLVNEVFHRSVTKITTPNLLDYIALLGDVATLKLRTGHQMELQAKFMTFIADLGKRSLNGTGSGIGYFRIPNLTPVFVLSNKSAIHQLYSKKNDNHFGQKKFFGRLAIILGDDNLMSSELGTNTHTNIRQAILSRNESFRPHVAHVVKGFFSDYAAQPQKTQLKDLMDILSRRVLISTYFGQDIVASFEQLYNPRLTSLLIETLFSLEPINSDEHSNLQLIRDKILTMGYQLIFITPGITKQLMQEHSWLNYLLVVRVLKNETYKEQLDELGITTTDTLSAEECERLIVFSRDAHERDSLALVVRDVINESLFIPLLGFDATASVLITVLRIVLQDKRIYAIIQSEMNQNDIDNHFELRSPWDGTSNGSLTYMEAVVLEALRLSPPAPIIPEIMHKAVQIEVDGTSITLPKDAMVFMPMEGMHSHEHHFPNINLSKKGADVLRTSIISSEDIFPERWGPKTSTGVLYNGDFFLNEPVFFKPGDLEKNGGFLTFKTGARRCPGLRIALTEVLSLFHELANYKFELIGEDELLLHFNYTKALQRNGGNGLLKITPNSRVNKELFQPIGTPFFHEGKKENTVSENNSTDPSVQSVQALRG